MDRDPISIQKNKEQETETERKYVDGIDVIGRMNNIGIIKHKGEKPNWRRKPISLSNQEATEV